MFRDINIAKQVSAALLGINDTFEQSLIEVRNQVPPEEAKEYGLVVGGIINHIFEALLDPIYAVHPSIRPTEYKQ